MRTIKPLLNIAGSALMILAQTALATESNEIVNLPFFEPISQRNLESLKNKHLLNLEIVELTDCKVLVVIQDVGSGLFIYSITLYQGPKTVTDNIIWEPLSTFRISTSEVTIKKKNENLDFISKSGRVVASFSLYYLNQEGFNPSEQ